MQRKMKIVLAHHESSNGSVSFFQKWSHIVANNFSLADLNGLELCNDNIIFFLHSRCNFAEFSSCPLISLQGLNHNKSAHTFVIFNSSTF